MENEVTKLFLQCTEYPETGLIMASDLQLHFTAMLVSPLLALSFSKFYILKAQTTKPIVGKY